MISPFPFVVHYRHSPHKPESVHAHSGLLGFPASRAAHMPEFHSGIVAALLEYMNISVRACKHACHFCSHILIAARAKKAEPLSSWFCL